MSSSKKDGDLSLQYEFALQYFKELNSIIQLLDQKAAISLIILGILVSIFVEISSQVSITFTGWNLDLVRFVFGLLCLVSFSIQTWLLVARVIVPRSAVHYTSEDKSQLYWNHITSFNRSELREIYRATEISTMIDLVSDQIYELSRIVKLKTDYYRIAMYWMIASGFFLLVYGLTVKLGA